VKNVARWLLTVLVLASASVATGQEEAKVTAPEPAKVAGQEEAKAVIKAVEAKYKTVSVMKAAFVQTTHSEVFGDEKQQGEVTLKRPGMMRWDFRNGVDRQFVTDGTKMRIYNKTENQVIEYNDVSSSASAADSLLQSLDRMDELFDIEMPSPTDDGYVMILRPKETEQLKKLKLVLEKDLVVRSVTITDAFDNITELAFSEMKFNVEAPDSIFKFIAPAGAEVISTSNP